VVPITGICGTGFITPRSLLAKRYFPLFPTRSRLLAKNPPIIRSLFTRMPVMPPNAFLAGQRSGPWAEEAPESEERVQDRGRAERGPDQLHAESGVDEEHRREHVVGQEADEQAALRG
jgi:hypothetical protein